MRAGWESAVRFLGSHQRRRRNGGVARRYFVQFLAVAAHALAELAELARRTVARAHDVGARARPQYGTIWVVIGDSTQTAPSAAPEHALPRGEGLLLVAGEGLITTFPLARDEITIGRAPDCDVVIAHNALSRHHARLRLSPSMTIEDLGSRNGTRLRGVKLEAGEAGVLAVGETFQIGRLHFVVARASRGASPGRRAARPR